jgi:hypothetical protein
MADSSSDGSVGSWPGLFDQINKTFNLVRDAFGYALPGGAFLGIGLLSGQFNLWQVRNLLAPYQLPAWAAFLAIVAICYPVGTVMAALAYMPFMLVKNGYWIWKRHWATPVPAPAATQAPEIQGHIEHHDRTGRVDISEDFIVRPPAAPDPADPPDGSWAAWLLYHPTEVAPRTMEIRCQTPKLLDTLDRRETLTLLAASMSSAFFYGWVAFFWLQLHFRTMIVLAAIATYIQFLTGLPHLRRVTQATYAADKTISKKAAKDSTESPDFSQLMGALIQAATDALKKIGQT